MLQVDETKHARLQCLAGRLGESLVAGDIAALACLNSRQSTAVDSQPIQESPRSTRLLVGQSPDSASDDSGIAAAMRYLQGSAQQTDPQAADAAASTRSPSDTAAATLASEAPHTPQHQLYLQLASGNPAKLTRVERIISEWPPPAGGKLGSPEGPGPLQPSDQSNADTSDAPTTDVGLQAAQHLARLAKLGSMDPDKASSVSMHLLGKSLAMHVQEQQGLESPDEAALQQLIDAVCSCLAVSSSLHFYSPSCILKLSDWLHCNCRTLHYPVG